MLFTRTTDLVQRLQQARQALSLESAIEKLDNNLCSSSRTFAMCERISGNLGPVRVDRCSLRTTQLIVTANHPFGEWTSLFPDAAMTLAAVDRLVHHSTIFEMNVESYRRRVAAARAPRKPRRVPATARAIARRHKRTGLPIAETCNRSPLSFVHVTEFRGDLPALTQAEGCQRHQERHQEPKPWIAPQNMPPPETRRYTPPYKRNCSPRLTASFSA